MVIKLYEENPSAKCIKSIVECLSDGGVIIYPTDTVYAFGCCVAKPKALERIARIKNIDAKKHNFTLVFENLSQVAQYTRPIANPTFKLLKKVLPGPYTFILEANKQIPKVFQNKKKQVGIRIPNSNIVSSIVHYNNGPLLSTSVYDNSEEQNYISDPFEIEEIYSKHVDIIIDGGFLELIPSTVIDCTENQMKIIRQGKGEIENFL